MTFLCLSWENEFYIYFMGEKCSVKLGRKELELVSYAPACMEECLKNVSRDVRFILMLVCQGYPFFALWFFLRTPLKC